MKAPQVYTIKYIIVNEKDVTTQLGLKCTQKYANTKNKRAGGGNNNKKKSAIFLPWNHEV